MNSRMSRKLRKIKWRDDILKAFNYVKEWCIMLWDGAFFYFDMCITFFHLFTKGSELFKSFKLMDLKSFNVESIY